MSLWPSVVEAVATMSHEDINELAKLARERRRQLEREAMALEVDRRLGFLLWLSVWSVGETPGEPVRQETSAIASMRGLVDREVLGWHAPDGRRVHAVSFFVGPAPPTEKLLPRGPSAEIQGTFQAGLYVRAQPAETGPKETTP